MTGASGFIGSRVTKMWLATDMELVAVGRSDLDPLLPGALADYVARQSPDVFLHLAWTAGGTPGYRESGDNQKWAAVSHEVAIRCVMGGIRFVGTGTVLDDPDQPIEETDPYTDSKRALRASLSREIASGNLTWLRPFYVFDPLGDRPGVLRAARRAAEEHRAAPLASAEALHDFVHVTDVVRGIISAIGNSLTGVVDIGSGTLHRVADLVSRAGYDWEESGREPGRLQVDRVADIAPLRETGWAPSETERFFGHG